MWDPLTTLLRTWRTFLVVRHLHASGRWDRALELLRADLERWIDAIQPDVVTLTEAGDGGRGRALIRPGWSRYQHAASVGADECAIGWRDAVARLVAAQSVPVSRLTYARKNGKRSPRFFAAMAALQLVEAAGEVIVYSVLHTPSAVDGPQGFRGGMRSVVYRAVIPGWKFATWRFAHQVRKDLAARGIKVRVHRVLVGDFNLHLLRKWAKAFLGRIFTGMANLWDQVKPNGGTLAWRLIDTAWLSRSLRAIAGQILGQARSSDHKAFWYDAAILPRRRAARRARKARHIA